MRDAAKGLKPVRVRALRGAEAPLFHGPLVHEYDPDF